MVCGTLMAIEHVKRISSHNVSAFEKSSTFARFLTKKQQQRSEQETRTF